MPKNVKKLKTPSESSEEPPSVLDSESDHEEQLGAKNFFDNEAEEGESEEYGEEGEDDLDDFIV